MKGSTSIQDDHGDCNDPDEPKWSLTDRVLVVCPESGQEVQKSEATPVIDRDDDPHLPPWPGAVVNSAVPIADAEAAKDPRPEQDSQAVVERPGFQASQASQARGVQEMLGASYAG